MAEVKVIKDKQGNIKCLFLNGIEITDARAFEYTFDVETQDLGVTYGGELIMERSGSGYAKFEFPVELYTEEYEEEKGAQGKHGGR